MKVTHKCLMVNLEIPVKVGGLECTVEFQVCRDLGTDDIDEIEFVDITNISYLGVPLKGHDNWNRFQKFHMEYGIDWNQAIEGEAMKEKRDIIDFVNELY